MDPKPTTQLRKVFYRPIEAAIRWSNLQTAEDEILRLVDAVRNLPLSDLDLWPGLRLNAERLYDAIANGELACGIDGITVKATLAFDHPKLTIRHVDLREWMIRFYPNERPMFLFGNANERREKTPERPRTRALQSDSHDQHLTRGSLELRGGQLEADHSDGSGTRSADPPDATALSPRAEATYLHIIGALLKLFLLHSPSGERYSRFKTQESIITALVAHFGRDLMGISERTLHAKFAQANRTIDQT